jgi:hypothetical protein
MIGVRIVPQKEKERRKEGKKERRKTKEISRRIKAIG